MRKEYASIFLDSVKELKNLLGENYVKSFLYGSVAKGLVNEDSDIDILCIGKCEKSLKILVKIADLLHQVSKDVEINVKYYEYNKFKKLIDEGNTFLLSIKSSCIPEELVYELL